MIWAPLIRAMRAPVLAAGLPEYPMEGRRGPVWHLSARVAAADRVLSDREWAEVARELLDGVGVAARQDAGGPRWVAIRHADDHIHVAVVMVRQDSGQRIWPRQDYARLRTAARRIEQRLGLTMTAEPDGTAAPAPGRGELEKARRQGGLPARVELARAVRAAAVAADGPDGFVAALEQSGYLVRLRRAPWGDLQGYTIARRGDVCVAGRPVFYSGSKLAPDLSLPRLQRAWAEAAQGTDAVRPVEAACRRVERARRAVGADRRGQGGEDPNGIVSATRDVLTAVAGWSDDLRTAAEVFDRAARPPRGTTEVVSRSGSGLRRVARQLIRHGPPGGDDPGAATVALVIAVVALLQEISAWQRERGRGHQAVASGAAAAAVDRWVRATQLVEPRSRGVLAGEYGREHGSSTLRARRSNAAVRGVNPTHR